MIERKYSRFSFGKFICSTRFEKQLSIIINLLALSKVKSQSNGLSVTSLTLII